MSTHAYPIQDNPAPMRTRESCYSDLRQCLISYEHQQLKQAAQAPGSLDSPLLPRGVMERAFASHRSFWVRPGEVVELIDIEDEVWWQVRKLPAATVQELREGYSPIAASDKGWVPAQHVRLLVRRASDSARLFAGSAEWKQRREDGQDEDREVAALLAYRQILAWRAARGEATPLFACERLLDHPVAHAAVLAAFALHAAAVARLAPAPWQLGLGGTLGFVAVDLLSTVYHLCLDYTLLSTERTTVTDVHHQLPLNYNLFPRRSLLAASYLCVAPLHALHLALHLLLGLLGATAPLFAVYTLTVLVLGCSCAFVHNAAHRRRHGLEIPGVLWLLQDVGVLLHPDVHSAHHQGLHDTNFSLFSGVTHPLTNRLLGWAWEAGWLPRTPETERAKMD